MTKKVVRGQNVDMVYTALKFSGPFYGHCIVNTLKWVYSLLEYPSLSNSYKIPINMHILLNQSYTTHIYSASLFVKH